MPAANDYCPCGSGRKFKRCCREREFELSGGLDVEALDRDVTIAVADWVRSQDPQQFERGYSYFREHLEGDEGYGMLPFALHLAAFHSVAEDHRRWVEVYCERRSGDLAENERQWLGAAIEAWFSYWRLEDVGPGRMASTLDLITGERRTVVLPCLDRPIAAERVLLTRVTRFGKADWITGSHPVTLREEAAQLAIEAFRENLGLAAGPLPPVVLRGRAAHALAGIWTDILEEVRRIQEDV